MKSIDDLFAKFGGMALFSEATGIKYNTAAAFKMRGSIPIDYWKIIEARAKRFRIEGVDRYALLDLMIAKFPDERIRPTGADTETTRDLRKRIKAALGA